MQQPAGPAAGRRAASRSPVYIRAIHRINRCAGAAIHHRHARRAAARNPRVRCAGNPYGGSTRRQHVYPGRTCPGRIRPTRTRTRGFQQLSHKETPMYFDIIDMTDSNLGNNRIQGLNNLSVASTQLQFYGMSNGVAQMVTDIKNALAGGQIDVLRIWGHGGPGLQNITAGTSGSSANADFSGLTQDNYKTVGIDGLSGQFTSTGWLELRGCSVGADDPGKQLLTGLAALLGVNVYAGDVTQWTVNWTPPVSCGTAAGDFSVVDGPKLNGNQT